MISRNPSLESLELPDEPTEEQMCNRIPIPNHPNNGNAVRNGHAHKAPSPPVCDGAVETERAPEPEPNPVAKPAPKGERTATGKFAKGNRCGLGNPFARRLGALRSAFLNAVTDEDVAAVARKLAQLAAAGDVQAAALFMCYAVGKPQPAVNPDRLDLDEFSIADAAPTKARTAAVMINAMDPAVAAALARSLVSTDPSEATAAVTKMNKRGLEAVLAEEDARIGKPAG